MPLHWMNDVVPCVMRPFLQSRMMRLARIHLPLSQALLSVPRVQRFYVPEQRATALAADGFRPSPMHLKVHAETV